MKRLSMSLMMVITLSAIAQAQQTLEYPNDENDPAFQIPGYTLVIETGFAEQIGWPRSWAVTQVENAVSAKISSIHNNLKVRDIWGGGVSFVVVDQAWTPWPLWYYVKTWKAWYWKPQQ